MWGEIYGVFVKEWLSAPALPPLVLLVLSSPTLVALVPNVRVVAAAVASRTDFPSREDGQLVLVLVYGGSGGGGVCWCSLHWHSVLRAVWLLLLVYLWPRCGVWVGGASERSCVALATVAHIGCVIQFAVWSPWLRPHIWIIVLEIMPIWC